jgi:ribosomal protein S2
MKNQKILIKNNIKKNLNTTPLIDELISYGAFIGEHYKWTHYSQTSFILGYKNNYSFYDIQLSMKLLTKAGRFLKTASKNKNVKFIFVGNPHGGEEQSTIIFNNIGIKFFPNEKWEPGFFSKKPNTSNYILVVYNLCINNIAFNEGVNANIPVVAFATPSCDIRGVDYPVILNLKNNKMWYAKFIKALFIK